MAKSLTVFHAGRPVCRPVAGVADTLRWWLREVIVATLQTLAAGKITAKELPILRNDTMLRYAPGFGKEPPPAAPNHPYTVEGLAKFLGELKEGTWFATESFKATFGALELIDGNGLAKFLGLLRFLRECTNGEEHQKPRQREHNQLPRLKHWDHSSLLCLLRRILSGTHQVSHPCRQRQACRRPIHEGAARGETASIAGTIPYPARKISDCILCSRMKII